jgi:hypothetical protein
LWPLGPDFCPVYTGTLWHESAKTIEIYTHVSRLSLDKIRSTLEILGPTQVTGGEKEDFAEK